MTNIRNRLRRLEKSQSSLHGEPIKTIVLTYVDSNGPLPTLGNEVNVVTIMRKNGESDQDLQERARATLERNDIVLLDPVVASVS